MGADNGIATTTTINLGASLSSTLDLNSYDQTIAGITKGTYGATVSNSVAATTSTLTINNSVVDTFDGVIQNGAGTVALTKSGSSDLILTGTNTYTGDTNVSAGTLFVNGALGNTATTVGANAALGGTGAIAGAVDFTGSSILNVVNLSDPLATTSTVNFASGFGVDNLTGQSFATMPTGTYRLLTGGAYTTTNLDNFGQANAYDFGNGFSGYFTVNGSDFQLVIVPETSSLILACCGLFPLLRRRRSFE